MARIAGGLALLALLAVPIALVRYEQARDAWRAQGAAIDTAAYDPDASDAAYREVEVALVWVVRTAQVAAALLLAAGFVLGRACELHTRTLGTTARRIAARAIDVATLAFALGLTRVGAESPGVRECLDWLAPALVLALVLGAAANGATLGDHTAGLAVRA